jgi:hypothetical protein
MDSDYFCLFVVDLDTGLVKAAKPSPWYETTEQHKSMPYTALMMKFASDFEGETREFFEKLADPKT